MLLHLSRCPIQRMLGLLRDLKELGHLPHECAPRKQYRRGEECVHLVWHHILHAAYWSLLGRHVLGKGMLVLTVSTTLPWMIQSSNHSEIHRITVYVGLYLTALGNGGIKPCTSTFGADQFDITDPTERVKKGSFFNWFYFLNTIGSLLSTTVIVWVQDNVGWGIGFAIPMILTSLSFTVFIASRRIYRYKSTGESPMTTASRVVVAAARNRRLELPEDCTTLHHSPSPPSEATFNVQHTTQFR
uniref:Uncharacterized protein n=1 Tax=Aegilops tauschii subsp. strangulata TaxID=200361 RepID=A0A453A7T4_AEGTS